MDRGYSTLTKLLIFRRETGNCKVCWSADAQSDVGVSAFVNAAKGIILVRFIHIFLSFQVL